MSVAAALPAVAAPAGWEAALRLRFAREGGVTRLVERAHRGPLVVQRPFHPEGDVCHVYVVHPPGGVVGGDSLRLTAQVEAGAAALLTTPAAGKFYRSAGPRASLHQDFTVADGALEWLPQENIFYPGARARIGTRVQLQGTARFIGWEMGCFGLPARGEVFESGEARQSFELWHEDSPLLIERLRVDAAVAQGRWGLAGHPACGSLLAYPAIAQMLQLARSVEFAGVALACTLVDGVLACRAIADRADLLRAAFVSLWQALRPALLERAAAPPRIWAT